jgi:hypothetical protein
MKQALKKSILVAALSGTLVGASALAQETQTPTQETPTTPTQPTPDAPPFEQMEQRDPGGFGGHDGRGPGRGVDLFRGLELGTTLTATFYDGNPEEGGSVLETLNFTYGEDSEVAFQEQFETARATAAFVTIETSEQTRTVDLADFSEEQREDLRPRELARPRMLNDDSTITATFYNGDPEAGGTVTETLTFTYGVSSEAGFLNDFSTAAKTAAFVTITTSPQTRTIDLAAMPVDSDGRGEGFGPGFGRPDFDGPRGPR